MNRSPHSIICMAWTNYHSHTYYCDGKGSPEQYLAAAAAKGFLAWGVSSHGPADIGKSWTMRPDRFEAYIHELQVVRQRLRSAMEVYIGLELDYIPGVAGRSAAFRAAGVEYIVGSVHVAGQMQNGAWWEIDGGHYQFLRGIVELFGGSAEAAVTHYYRTVRDMMRDDRPEIVGHLDKIKIQAEDGKLFSEDAPWYRQAVMETLEEIRGHKAIIEVNTRGMLKKITPDPYPSPWILKEMHHMGIPVTLSSDAHHPDDTDAYFAEVAAMLRRLGYRQMSLLYKGGWQVADFDEKGLYL
ncbi:MAG: histidinol-phosphatase [Bacteroidia bacterium]|nr:histidinol-phosphatase [Bacteroidia bacterium]